MSSIYEIASRFGQLKEELPKLAVISLDDDLSYTLERLSDGLKADGSGFPEYTSFTIQMKQQTGGFISPSGRIALKDTGAFHQSLVLKKYSEYAEIESNDPKLEKITSRFGDEVLDISEDEAQQMIDDSRENLIENVNNFLFQ